MSKQQTEKKELDDYLNEPKAGDEVEARMTSWPVNIWRVRKYLGVKSSRGTYVCECYSDGGVNTFDEIRRFKPTKSQDEIDREKAREIFNSHQSHFTDDVVIEMLLKMAKYGRETK